MKSRAKNLMFIGIFVLSLLLVLLILVLTQPKADKNDSSTTDTTLTIYSGSRDDIASMVITNEFGQYTVNQTVKGFSIEELKDLRQNTTILAAAGNCVSNIKAQALVEEKAADMEKYGLSSDNPTASCKVTLKDGTTYTVLYGLTAPDGNSVYVRFADSNDVYVVLANSSRYFYGAVENYISVIVKEELTNESVAPTIDYLTITRKDWDFVMQFEDDTKNYALDDVSMASSQVMISPVYAYLDITNSNDIIYGIWGLTAEAAIKPFPTEEDLAEYGLDDPYCVLDMDAELQKYKLLIGNVAAYETDENGKDTNEPASFYGYYEGIDVIFRFAASEVKWATFEPVDILSSMMTSNYIYSLDYVDLQFHNGEDVSYYLDVFGEEEDKSLGATLDGQMVDVEALKIYYQFLLKCPIDSICLEEPKEDAKLLCYIRFERRNGGGDTLEFYDDGANRVIIKLNGTTSFSQPKSYLDVLCENTKLFKNGASADDFQMVW